MDVKRISAMINRKREVIVALIFYLATESILLQSCNWYPEDGYSNNKKVSRYLDKNDNCVYTIIKRYLKSTVPWRI